MTMQRLFEEWIIFRRDETAAKPATIRKDMLIWRTHIKDASVEGTPLCQLKVSKINTRMLFSFFRRFTKDRSYSRQTVNNLRGVLSGMFSYAIERNIIQSNPIKNLDLKRMTFKPVQSKREDVFTIEEAQKLLEYLEYIEDDPYALAIRLDFNLFARVGEIAGLTWENVDIKNRRIYICHQMTYEPTLNDDLTFSEKIMVEEDYLKGCTSQGYRTEYLTDEAVDILIKARELNPDGRHVFMPFGKPIITNTFNKRLRKYCAKAGVTYHSSHKIRFYAASVAYDGNNISTISQMMGHSQLSTTMHYMRDVLQNDDVSDIFKSLGKQ